MKTIQRILMLLGLGAFALAQTNTLNTTTLTSALTGGTASGALNCFAVGSTTNISGPAFNNGPFGGSQGTVGSFLLMGGEEVQVQSVNSPNVCGWRGVGGTKVVAHLATELILIGNADWFSQSPAGVRPTGGCTKSTLYAYPDVHPIDNTWWGCTDGGYWGFAGPGFGSALGSPVMVHKITATTYTALAWDYMIEVNTASAAITVTLPTATQTPGKVFVFNDYDGDAATHAITVSTTVPAGCASISANNGTSRVMSDGTSWVCF